MIPFAVFSIIGSLLLIRILFPGKKPKVGIPKSEVHNKFMIRPKIYNRHQSNKKQISKSINKIIRSSKNFKIGKTGNPYSRGGNYHEFKKMYLLCGSRNERYIERLEEEYLEEYIDHQKNENINTGSGGNMRSKSGSFYLYVVVN